MRGSARFVPHPNPLEPARHALHRGEAKFWPGGAWSVTGTIDGQVVSTRWDPDREALTDCDPELRSRAEIVVAMGEEFVDADGHYRVKASLEDGAGPALLTVLRALGNVLTVELDMPDAP